LLVLETYPVWSSIHKKKVNPNRIVIHSPLGGMTATMSRRLCALHQQSGLSEHTLNNCYYRVRVGQRKNFLQLGLYFATLELTTKKVYVPTQAHFGFTFLTNTTLTIITFMMMMMMMMMMIRIKTFAFLLDPHL
jgi:hypothetical protein